MPVFLYKAADTNGALVEGRVEAASQDAAIKRLQGDGQTPIRVEPERAGNGVGNSLTGALSGIRLTPERVTHKDLSVFTLELATLLQAGLTLDRALDLMETLAGQGPMGEMVGRVHAAVRRGSDLSMALEEEGPPFTRFYLNIVKAGEASGALDLALARLNEFMERSRALRETLTAALFYPCILLVFAALSLLLILGVVIPRISQMFADAGAQLPLATRLVVGGGELVNAYWWVGGLVLVGIYGLWRAKADDEQWRYGWDLRFLRLPFVGELIAKYEAARFTRTLGTLLENDVPLLNGLMIARQAVANRAVSMGLEQVSVSVRAGQGVARPLLQAEVFPKLAGHLMQVGEQTGNLQEMLLKLADIYDREVQATLKRMVDILGPVLILGLGLVIAGIIMSVLAAILSVNELAF